MKKIAEFFYDTSNWISCGLATLLMGAYASLVMGGFSSCFEIAEPGPSSLGLSFGYSYETVLQFFTNRNEEAIRCYVHFISLWDNIFPLVYSLMYIYWLSFLWKNVEPRRPLFRLLNLYPLLMIFMDWTENFLEVMMANHYLATGSLSASQVELASLVSMAKWMVSIGCYVLILIGIFFAIKQRLNKSATAS